jgi:hypothetical protein
VCGTNPSTFDLWQAIFAFRAHTPEGHLVDQIGAIADVLFATRYRWFPPALKLTCLYRKFSKVEVFVPEIL